MLGAMVLLIGCGDISPNLGVAPTQSSTVTSVFPQTAVIGQNTAPITIIVSGEGFVSGSLVLWNFQPLTTTYVNTGQLTAIVPLADLANPATASVGVISPGRTTQATAGNNLSNFIAFTIYASSPAAPTISVLSPDSAAVGGPAFTLTVTGTNFLSTSTVLWNNQACPFTNPSPATPICITVPGSATQLAAQIPVTYIATVPSTQPAVSVSTPGGGTSNSLTFTITSAQSNALKGLDAESVLATTAPHSPSITAGPRYVAFVAAASGSSSGTATGVGEIFLQDTCQGASSSCTPQTTLISTPIYGTVPDGASRTPSISADGRFVVFASDATNLVPGDNNGAADIFLRDTCNGAPSGCTPATTLISVAPDGSEANAASASPSISPDGRYVAFDSLATNLIVDGSSTATAVTSSVSLLRDTCFGAASGCTPSTTRLTITALPTQ
jgi:trimeric autotransporter adhesin